MYILNSATIQLYIAGRINQQKNRTWAEEIYINLHYVGLKRVSLDCVSEKNTSTKIRLKVNIFFDGNVLTCINPDREGRGK